MVDYRLIRASEHIEQMMPILCDHWEELGRFHSVVPYAPDFDTVWELERNDQLMSIGVFDGDKLCGYSVNIITTWLHSCEDLMCQNVVLWLEPEYRKGLCGVQLIRFTEAMARGMGAKVFLLSGRPNTVMFELLPKLKYETYETVFARVLT